MTDSMPALVNTEPETVSLEEVPVPEPGPEDVLIEVRAVGICGSDIHQWHGSHSWPVEYPCTLGHEFGGVVAELGEDVTSFDVGDRVVSETAAVIDEDSPMSRQGLYNLDPDRKGFGYGVDGAMAHYVTAPERCLHDIPDDLAFEYAALTEPCSVAYNAVCVNNDVNPGDDVLVIGPGPIGILCAAMASLSGGRVIVSGLPEDERRLEVAKEMGAAVTTTDDPVEYVEDLGDGLGVDAVVDSAGVSATLEVAMDAVRPDGTITKVGWGPEPMEYSMDPLVQKAATIEGSFSHNWPVWENVISMLSTGQLDLEPIVSHVAPLEEWESCFRKMDESEYIKAVLKPQESQLE
ncbi:alcohol dehydrogenase catalytic domain-containing protein [Halomontanus rarus]|uniref:alcohol dehydrogenase catalytic domain-containing protein n=1 Tax=Halomontanus rarus TaxID=3034020 RepID=UPI001A99554E